MNCSIQNSLNGLLDKNRVASSLQFRHTADPFPKMVNRIGQHTNLVHSLSQLFAVKYRKFDRVLTCDPFKIEYIKLGVKAVTKVLEY